VLAHHQRRAAVVGVGEQRPSRSDGALEVGSGYRAESLATLFSKPAR
jgi:hypothetical protein